MNHEAIARQAAARAMWGILQDVSEELDVTIPEMCLAILRAEHEWDMTGPSEFARNCGEIRGHGWPGWEQALRARPQDPLPSE